MAIFPNRPFDHAADYADAYFARLAEAAASVDRAALDRAAALITAAAQEGRRIYSCGNGGSAAIANHLVCDCLKGIRNESTLRPEVVSLSTTIELITAIGNDLGYDQIFSYQLESLGRPGDVLMAISSSGNSPNILAAIQAARAIGMTVIAMTGFDGGAAARMADVSLHVRAENYGLVEDVHQAPARATLGLAHRVEVEVEEVAAAAVGGVLQCHEALPAVAHRSEDERLRRHGLDRGGERRRALDDLGVADRTGRADPRVRVGPQVGLVVERVEERARRVLRHAPNLPTVRLKSSWPAG